MGQYNIYFSNAGVPAAGLTPTISWLNYDGSSVGAAGPTVNETDAAAMPGWYNFSASPTQDIILTIDAGATIPNAERYIAMTITADDFAITEARLANLDAAVSSRSTFDSASDSVDVTSINSNAVTTADDFKADVSSITASSNITQVNGVAVALNDFHADVSGLSTFDHTADEVSADITKVASNVVTGIDDFKADVSGITASTNLTHVNGNPVGINDFHADVSSLSTFDAATDTVDVGKIAGNAVTNVTDFHADVSGLSTFDPAADTVVQVTNVDSAIVTRVGGTVVTSPGDLKADVSGLSTFDAATDTVSADVQEVLSSAISSIDDFKADTSGITASADLTHVNGVAVVIDDFKADVSGIAASTDLTHVNGVAIAIDDFKADVSGLSTFDSGADMVHSNVREVNSAAVSISDFKADTSDLLSYAGKTYDRVKDIKTIVENLLNRESGKWEILDNQMVFYEGDGTTVIQKFNLFDEHGNPTVNSPFSRVPA